METFDSENYEKFVYHRWQMCIYVSVALLQIRGWWGEFIVILHTRTHEPSQCVFILWSDLRRLKRSPSLILSQSQSNHCPTIRRYRNAEAAPPDRVAILKYRHETHGDTRYILHRVPIIETLRVSLEHDQQLRLYLRTYYNQIRRGFWLATANVSSNFSRSIGIMSDDAHGNPDISICSARIRTIIAASRLIFLSVVTIKRIRDFEFLIVKLRTVVWIYSYVPFCLGFFFQTTRRIRNFV